MLRTILLLVVLAVGCYAGWGHDHGHDHGHGHHHSPHGGWGWGKKYHGWANVKAWNGPWSYNFGLDEHGKDYNRYAWQQAEFSKGWHGK